MKLLAYLTGAWVSSVCLALPSYPGHGNGWKGRGGQAVYFLRVDPQGSSVVAIKVGRNGMLQHSTSVTSTDGVGLQAQNASNALAPTAIDPLQGQQAVSIGDDYLFTINSGSNTAVMFAIDPQDPLKLSMVGQPVPTLGDFAMSIAYSTKYQKACVLNGGANNGVACFCVHAEQGLVPDGVGLRKFGLPGTTPPRLGGSKGSGSDIQFTGDSSKLISVYKGNSKPATLAHIYVFDVDGSGNVASTATDNRVNPLGAAFGFALSGDDKDRLYITDAAYGGVLVSLDYETNQMSALSVVNNTAFAASCWAVWSSATNTYYDINAGSTNIGKVDPAGSLVGVINYTTALAGGVDTVADGNKLYVLTSTNAVAVLDASSGNVLQQYTYSTSDDRPYWTGLAMYPANPLLSGGV